MANYFVTVAGNIGVGKSTLVRLLADRLGWEPVFEAVGENPYLPDFYRDMSRWGFHSQVYFLSKRLRQHHALLLSSGSAIQDRSVYEDAEVFARNLHDQGHLVNRDWAAYNDLYETLATLLRPPDLVIYLQASVATLQRRIRLRGRDFEQSIESDYLASLNSLYERWIARFKASPVLTVNTDNLNVIENEAHVEMVQQRMMNRLHGRDFIALD